MDILDIKSIDISSILYKSINIDTPFMKQLRIIFADDTASGRPSKYIDNKIQEEILPYYSNTHSNAYCGILMKNKIIETRNIIKKFFNLTEEHKIIFTGNGATGAINHLANSLNYEHYTQVNIFLSMYEHYSNHLPWCEMAKKEKNIKIFFIPMINDDIDLNYLDLNLSANISTNILNIITVTACSNVTGIITEFDKIINITKKYDNIYLFGDCACLAPYKVIDCSKIDAIFVSTHKFIGGTGTPGILIAKNKLFEKECPFIPGGGCVKKANSKEVIYDQDIEVKETAGTPNIIGIIKIGYIFELRNKFIDIINYNEHSIVNYVHHKLENIKQQHSNLSIIFMSKFLNRRLPIIAFSIKNLHYNFIVVLLNDLFGIQTRGGISCCGLFDEYLNSSCDDNNHGWCRITFNWMMDKQTIDYILRAILYILKYGYKYNICYDYDKQKNLFNYNGKKRYDIKL